MLRDQLFHFQDVIGGRSPFVSTGGYVARVSISIGAHLEVFNVRGG